MVLPALVQTGGSGALIAQIVPFLVIIGIFYFLVLAPASKQRKKTEAMLAALKKGDRVITTSGIHGTIQGLENDIVYLKIAENVKIKVAKSAIANVLSESASE